jgi:hypothetical protein
MQIVRLGLVLAGLALGAPALAAQQPASPHMPPRRPPGMMMDSAAMAGHADGDSLDARLDTLVSRMNKATGDRMAAWPTSSTAGRPAPGDETGMQRMMQSPDGRCTGAGTRRHGGAGRTLS